MQNAPNTEKTPGHHLGDGWGLFSTWGSLDASISEAYLTMFTIAIIIHFTKICKTFLESSNHLITGNDAAG